MSPGGWDRVIKHQSRLARLGIAILCLLLITTVFIAPSAKAENSKTCIMLIDFGDGSVNWTDVQVKKGMNGFDVFENATKAMGLSESHSPTPPYGHTVIRVGNSSMQYNWTNPAASGKLWRLWLWDSEQGNWTWSYTLLDGIDASSTPAIALKYHTDPAPAPSLGVNDMGAWPAKTVGPSPSNKPTDESKHESTNQSNNSPAPEPTSPAGDISAIASNFDYEVNNLKVTFEAPSSNESVGSNYTWNFGDGSIGEGRSVEHNYSTPGNFTVTLTGVNDTGETKNVSQTVRLALESSAHNGPAEANAPNEPAKSEGFPIWVWGVLALVLISGAEVGLLHRKRRKKTK